MSTIDEQSVHEAFARQIHQNQSEWAGDDLQALSSQPGFFVHDELPSTNRFLIECLAKFEASGDNANLPSFCIAARQSAGVGRRGTTWHSGTDCITFSMLDSLPLAPAQLSGLSLVTGVAIAETLQVICSKPLQLKWPNDVLVGNRKLSGILTEVPHFDDQATSIVTGIGINFAPDEKHRTIDRPIITIKELMTESSLQESIRQENLRDTLIGQLAANVYTAHQLFVQKGWAGFRERYAERDALAGKPVSMQQGAENISGVARGVAPDGALQLEIAGSIHTFSAGEVTLGHQNPKGDGGV